MMRVLIVTLGLRETSFVPIHYIPSEKKKALNWFIRTRKDHADGFTPLRLAYVDS